MSNFLLLTSILLMIHFLQGGEPVLLLIINWSPLYSDFLLSSPPFFFFFLNLVSFYYSRVQFRVLQIICSNHDSSGSSGLWQFHSPFFVFGRRYSLEEYRTNFFIECSSVGFARCFSHQTRVISFWEEDHRGKPPFSSYHVKNSHCKVT